MTQAVPGLSHLIDLIRSPRGGLAILGAIALSGMLVIRALAATLVVVGGPLAGGALPDAAQSTAYNQTITATGGTAPYTWTVTEGSLPTGLSLSAAGVITGSPSVLANSAFTAKVTDNDGNTATKSLAIKVNPQLTVTTTALAAGVQSVAYTAQQLAATGGSTPYTWSLDAGTTLPAGLTLSGAGAITGTPTAAGTTNFTVKVTDAGLPTGLTATKALSITVSGTGVLTVVTSSLPNGVQNVAGYSTTLTAAGGTPAYVNWLVSSGTLPAGLTLAPATGIISGTPTGTGTSNFSVTVTDSAGSPVTTAPKALSITVNAALAISSSDPLPGATAGTAYATVLAATGGTAPYSWTVSAGALPGGLTLFSAAGVISGVPTTAGANPFTVQATDANGVTITKPLSILVAAAVAPTITTTTLPNAIIGSSYTYQLQRSGGVAPYTWSVSTGTLPSGLTLDASTGLITGTPVVGAVSAPTLAFQVASSAGTSAAKALPITVSGASALNITTTTLPNATINVAYPTQTLARTGGVSPFTWTLASGSGPLPTGLVLNSNGTITGTPTVLGPITFTVQVTDSTPTTPLTDTQALTITVVAAGTPGTPGTGNGDYYGPCKAFYKSAAADLSKHASAFRRLLDAAGVTSQVQAFCDANGQPESIEDQEFRRLCTSFFSGSNSWRAGGSKVSGLRRLIEAAGSADAVRSFCTTNFGNFTGQECDDDDLHGVHNASYNSRDNDDDDRRGNSNNNGKKKGKS